MYAPSAIATRGGKFQYIGGEPRYVTVRQGCFCLLRNSTILFPQPTPVEDPQILVDLFKAAALNAREVGFDDVERMFNYSMLPKMRY